MTCDARGPDIHSCVLGMTVKALCDVYKHAVWDYYSFIIAFQMPFTCC